MRTKVTLSAIIAISILAAAPAWGQSAAGSGGRANLLVAPEAAVPAGPKMDFYEAGGGGLLALGFPFGADGSDDGGLTLSAELESAYSFLPISAGSYSLSLLRATGGLKLSLPLGERFELFAFGGGGGYYGMLNEGSGTGGYGAVARGGIGSSVALGKTVALAAGAAYASYFGLYEGLGAFVGTSLSLGGGSGAGAAPADGTAPGPTPETLPATEQVSETDGTDGELRIEETNLNRIFPVLFKYYDENPLGSATIANDSGSSVENLEVRFDAERIIDNPKLSADIAELAPGESREVDISALFNNQVLTITEGTRFAARIDINYEIGGEAREKSQTVTLSTYDRNALRWDDDRKIAAFVTARDDEIQRLGKNMAALSRRTGVDAVNTEMQLAMAQFAAMQERGLAYVVDPSSSYAELSKNEMAVDYVQFPRQTFQYQAGDCDDLSAAYTALLQSVGIDTAFITIPGHIYSAFRLDMSAREARSTFANSDDLIFRDDGTVWVPVETTLVEEGFMEAWATGARQWREHAPNGDAGFFRTGTAWEVYEPVAFSVSDAELPSPDQERVASLFETELQSFVGRQINRRERQLLSRLEENPNDPRLLNRIGVLYARYGRTDEARERFQQIVEDRPFAPAFVNLGNISFLEQQFEEAARYYEQALDQDPYSSAALVGRARVANRLENYDKAAESYEVLANLDQDLAERFSHLDPDSDQDSARAGSAAQMAQEVVWEETE